MPVSKRSRRITRQRENSRTATTNRAQAAEVTRDPREPFWGWTDLALCTLGIFLLVQCLYQIVLHFGLSAATAGTITDVPGSLGILYAVLRWRYHRSPWAALGWVFPRKRFYWAIAVAGGAAVGLLVMLIDNPTRFRIHFHTTSDALIFGVVFAGLVEETIWRGAVLPVILRYTKPFIAALLTGIIFAVSHGVYRSRIPPPSALFWITLSATAYGVLRIKSQSTFTAALMHACYNLTLFLWQGA